MNWCHMSFSGIVFGGSFILKIMEIYRNLSGKSNIFRFEIGQDFIKIIFKKNYKIYTYSYCKAGVHHVETMKKLAISGRGLNAYIKKYVNNLNN